MKNFRFTVGNKILFGFSVLIVIFVIYAGITIFTVTGNNRIIEVNSTVIKPSVTVIKDFNVLIIRSKMLVTNWVYLQSNETDKEALKLIHTDEYPQLKESMMSLMGQWDSQFQKDEMDTVFINFEELLTVQQEIMGSLTSFEDYEDPIVKFMASESIEREVIPRTDTIISNLNKVLLEKQNESEAYEKEVLESSTDLRNTSIILAIISVLIGLFSAYKLLTSITKPVNYIKDVIIKLGKGELPEDQTTRFSNDEIGDMAGAVDKLVDGLKETSFFAEKIGGGQYDSEYQPLSEEDVLGNALINMRSNLKRVAEEDKKRNWTTEGLAMFGDILRRNNDNISKLSDEIISSLVKYSKSNQGGLFVINNENDDDPYLELTACYAWDKKKYLEQKIYEGEGLTGQVWLEGQSIYMTEVPQDYVMITSGLGEANPNSLLIVPLKVNDEIFGVIELASFRTYEAHEREFVEKIAENIASTISSVKINERTSKLLNESREMTEQMRSQEEEMRQNMEELQATQEEMERSQRDREDKEKIINYTNMMIELNADMRISSINDITTQQLQYNFSDLNGTALSDLVASEEAFKALKAAMKAGKTWSGVIKLKDKSGAVLSASFSAGILTNQTGEDNKFLLIGSVISEEQMS
ncbi:MAG: PAS domain-containing protein [Marivirga sp.]|jgi:PAS domain-containing protein